MRIKAHLRRRPAPRLQSAFQGFTLLEVLLAIFIFGLVVSLIFGSFQGVFSSAEHVSASTSLYEMGTACLARMGDDLKALHIADYPSYKQPQTDREPDIYRVQGNIQSLRGGSFSRLRFTSLEHLTFTPRSAEGIAQIVYYIQEDETAGYVLRRADKLYPYPEFEENPLDPVICEQVLAFELIYYDEEGREFEEWDSEDDETEYSTPKSVRIKLTIGDGQTSLTFETAVTLPLYRAKQLKR